MTTHAPDGQSAQWCCWSRIVEDVSVVVDSDCITERFERANQIVLLSVLSTAVNCTDGAVTGIDRLN